MSDFTPHEAPIRTVQTLPVVLSSKPVGRDAELAQIYTQLKANHPVLIHGPAGVGKTTIAARLAGAYTQQPGGVLWLNVDNPSLEELLVRVGRAYNVSEITNSENPLGMIGAVENTLSSQKPFIVIDGAIQADMASRFISRCVTNLPILIINEEKIEGTWAALGIEKLNDAGATALYRQEARLQDDQQNDDIGSLVNLLDNMPLGIVVAARAMTVSKQTPAAYLTLVHQIVETAGDNKSAVALTASFRSLNGALQGLLLMLGATFRGAASAELISMVSSAPTDSIQQAMNILSQLRLVESTQRYGAFYYRLHPLTHRFAQTWLRGSNRLDELQTKVRDSTLDYAQKYSADTPDAHNKLALEMENLLATAQWDAEKDNRDTATQLVNVITQAGDFVGSRGYLFESLQLRALSSGNPLAFPAYDEPEEAIPVPEVDLEEAYEKEEENLESTFLHNVLDEAPEDMVLSDEETDTGAFEVNKLRSEIAEARQADDKEKQIELLKTLGQSQVDREMENEAIATYSEVLTNYEDLEDNPGTLETLDMLSALMVKTENSQAAVLHATRGIKLAEELKDDETRMHLLITLGDARQQLGESEDAANDYTQALTIARTSDDKQNEALILYKLGYAQLDNGEAQTAVDMWEQALTMFKAQEKRDYEGRVLGGLGSAYGELNRWAEAMNFHTSALHIARETGDKEEEGLQLGSLAYAATQTGQLGQAVLRYRQALHLAYENEAVDNIVSTVVDLARLLVESRRHIPLAELLVDDAITFEPNDKDVTQLKERIQSEKVLAESYGTQMLAVEGTAREYAANAYKLLEE